MDRDDLCYANASDQAQLIRTGQVSARELVAATLQRIGEVNPALNAFTVVMEDDAVADADAIDAEPKDDRPLLGVPVAIKDNVDVAGHRTSYGTAPSHRVADEDAPIVRSLRRAGAIVVGKTACSELAVWPFTETPAWGATRNPWDIRYSPGGSSGGSGAAVAAGLCGVALGSDGLGSIRAPAGFCGVVGLKPQYGCLWGSGRDWNGLSSLGPLARSVGDAAAFLDATALDPPESGYASALQGERPRLRIAVAFQPPAKWPVAATLGEEQRAAVEQTASTLRAAGHRVTEAEVGFPSIASYNYVVRYLTGIADELERVDSVARISKRTRRMGQVGRSLERARPWAERAAADFAEATSGIFDAFDVLLTPGAVIRAPRIGEFDGHGAVRTLVGAGRRIPHFAPWNSTGQPAISVPAGFSSLGLPLAVQLVGRPHGEATILRVAAELESHRPWSARRPPSPASDSARPSA